MSLTLETSLLYPVAMIFLHKPLKIIQWQQGLGQKSTLPKIPWWDISEKVDFICDAICHCTILFVTDIKLKIIFQLGLVPHDGIYPELAIFVQTMSEPLTNHLEKYERGQEASRNDVKHAFAS